MSIRSLVAVSVCVAALVLPTLVPAQETQERIDFLGFLAQPQVPSPNPAAGRGLSATLDPGLLRVVLDAVVAPDRDAAARVVLPLPGGAFIDVDFVRLEPTGFGQVLHGRVAGDAASVVTLAVHGDVVSGDIYSSRGGWSMHGTAGPGGLVISPHRLAVPLPGDTDVVLPEGRVPADAGPEANASVAEQSVDGYWVDVLVVYTDRVAAARGDQAGVLALMDNWVAWVNAAYVRSRIHTRLRLAGLVRARGYRAVEDTVIECLASVSDGCLDFVHGERERHSADLVHLVGAWEIDKFCGQADLLWPPSNPSPDYAFAVTHHDCGSWTFAHELGHNLGAWHDRHQEQLDGVALSEVSPPYAFGMVNRAALSRRNPELDDRWHTIMAYGSSCREQFDNDCTGVLYFSNPAVRAPGGARDPLGVPGSHRTSSLDGPANVARVHNLYSPVIAGFRSRTASAAGRGSDCKRGSAPGSGRSTAEVAGSWSNGSSRLDRRPSPWTLTTRSA